MVNRRFLIEGPFPFKITKLPKCIGVPGTRTHAGRRFRERGLYQGTSLLVPTSSPSKPQPASAGGKARLHRLLKTRLWNVLKHPGARISGWKKSLNTDETSRAAGVPKLRRPCADWGGGAAALKLAQGGSPG
jgi:hypothetical protein